jgi:pimeloyl-ACP methyl ester carboxylesterase
MRSGGTILRLLITLVLAAVRHAPALSLRLYRTVLPPADRRVVADPQLAQQLREEIRRQPRTTAAAVVQDLRLFARPWGVDVAAVTVPTEIWQGDADRAVPVEHARALTAVLPHASYHECPDSGHFLLVERAPDILRSLAT